MVLRARLPLPRALDTLDTPCALVANAHPAFGAATKGSSGFLAGEDWFPRLTGLDVVEIRDLLPRRNGGYTGGRPSTIRERVFARCCTIAPSVTVPPVVSSSMSTPTLFQGIFKSSLLHAS